MISVAAPLRLPLGGGGTDLPYYYSRRGGFLVAAALRDRVRVSLRAAAGGAPAADPWIEQALRHLGAPAGLEVRVDSDLPPRSGLGGSGAVLVALAHALRLWRGEAVSPRLLAEEAFRIERERMGRPVGKQDPYVAAYGGVLALRINVQGRTEARRLRLGRVRARVLERSLLLVDTGRRRDAARALGAQERAAEQGAGAIEMMDRIRALGRRAACLLESGRTAGLGAIFQRHWEIKERLTPHTGTAEARRCLVVARAAGARGGKLIGAGGGGFVLLGCGAQRAAVGRALREEGFAARRVFLEPGGSRPVAAAGAEGEAA